MTDEVQHIWIEVEWQKYMNSRVYTLQNFCTRLWTKCGGAQLIPTAVTLLLLLIISRHSSKLSPEGACSPSTELKQIHVGISTFSSSSNSKQACRSLHLSIKNVSVQGILPEDQIASNLSLIQKLLGHLGYLDRSLKIVLPWSAFSS